jgi:3-oxoacyl-[acyl-carrier protein] reductase
MDSLDVLEKELSNFGVKIDKFTCDVTSPDSIEKLAREINKKHKSIDFLFHLAGIGVYKKLPDVTYEEWKASMDINVTSVFYISKQLVPLLERSDKAYVVASGSGMGKVALSGRSPYCASKFALRGLMQSLAKEYKKTNIHFVHLTLGSVLTSFGPLSLSEKKRKHAQGKGYLDPTWLARHLVVRLENETLEPETPIYPRHYFKESKKDIR